MSSCSRVTIVLMLYICCLPPLAVAYALNGPCGCSVSVVDASDRYAVGSSGSATTTDPLGPWYSETVSFRGTDKGGMQLTFDYAITCTAICSITSVTLEGRAWWNLQGVSDILTLYNGDKSVQLAVSEDLSLGANTDDFRSHTLINPSPYYSTQFRLTETNNIDVWRARSYVAINTVTMAPTTAAPSTTPTARATTSEPTTSNPTTSNPTSQEPTTANPTTANPTTSNPTTTTPAPLLLASLSKSSTAEPWVPSTSTSTSPPAPTTQDEDTDTDAHGGEDEAKSEDMTSGTAIRTQVIVVAAVGVCCCIGVPAILFAVYRRKQSAAARVKEEQQRDDPPKMERISSVSNVESPVSSPPVAMTPMRENHEDHHSEAPTQDEGPRFAMDARNGRESDDSDNGEELFAAVQHVQTPGLVETVPDPKENDRDIMVVTAIDATHGANYQEVMNNVDETGLEGGAVVEIAAQRTNGDTEESDDSSDEGDTVRGTTTMYR